MEKNSSPKSSKPSTEKRYQTDFRPAVKPQRSRQDRTISQDALPRTHLPQGVPLVKPFQTGTRELRPLVQQLEKAGNTGLGDYGLGLLKRN